MVKVQKYVKEFEKLASLSVDDFVDIVINEYAEWAKNNTFDWDKVHAAAIVAARKEEENVQTRSSEN
jgi:hypothetical protein